MLQWRQLPFFVTAAFLMSLQPLLVAFSKDSEGGFSYSVPCSTMLSETLKLCISATLLLSERLAAGAAAPPLLSQEGALSEFFAFMVPGLIYFVNNNAQFFILQAIDPTSFQLLSQMKTIFTGLLFRVMLDKKLKPVQWLAIVILACGTAVSELPTKDHDKPVAEHGLPRYVGFLLCLMTSLFSALAGVYNEKLLKERFAASLHWQNIQLYLWGVMFNAIGLYMKDGENVRENGLLDGFTGLAYAVVLCNALTGLSISAVLKYADNIARVYAHAIAMLFTMAVSVKLLGTQLTPQLLIGVILVSVSTFQYNMPQSMLQEQESTPSQDSNDAGRKILFKEEASSLIKGP
eukprot:TRINITY_DN37700_c0_g1_i1.p1 TRINITY_DN37700_c0_g1~~TRINITY_DN37700_c0_g1_i1.p1  ORF type:complete len:348 (-),score=89.68 TRINITY_DN37700_c0_g1_i1:136-1179(-)